MPFVIHSSIPTLEVPRYFARLRRTYLLISPVARVSQFLENQRNVKENISDFSISTVPADSLVPLGCYWTRASACTILIKFGPRIHTELAPKGLLWWNIICGIYQQNPQMTKYAGSWLFIDWQIEPRFNYHFVCSPFSPLFIMSMLPSVSVFI